MTDAAMHSTSSAKGHGSVLFENCSEEYQGETSAVLLCVTQALEQQAATNSDNYTQWLLVLAGALVFFMQMGFAMLCAGCVRRKNVANAMLKNLLDATGAAIAFFALGFAFAFGGQDASAGITFLGTENFLLIGDVDYAFWFFQYAFSAAAVTIIAGTLAERCKMTAYGCYSLFMTGFVYPIVAHSIWSENGFLSAFSASPFLGVGCVDFAGGGVVHMTGGTAALVASKILGSRKGRFVDGQGIPLRKPKEIPGHSLSLQALGTFVLWFGWYGFNPGSALLFPNAESTGSLAALAAVNTTLSAAAGAITSLVTNLCFSWWANDTVNMDVTKAMNGLLSGLVAITGGAGVVEPWAAVLIGIIAGWVYLLASYLMVRLRIDDAVDGIPVHLFNGVWGLLAVGLFGSPGRLEAAFGSNDYIGFFYSLGHGETVSATLLANQVLEILFIFAWTAALMTPFFVGLNCMGWLRFNHAEEIAGLDAKYGHGVQEDHAELKKSILKEYKEYKKASRKEPETNSNDLAARSAHSRLSHFSGTSSTPPEHGEEAV